jgi:hypothetical protein
VSVEPLLSEAPASEPPEGASLEDEPELLSESSPAALPSSARA